MPRIARSEVVVPGKLTQQARESLIDSLYGIQREVFDGVDREAFAKYVVLSKAERTWILVHRGEGGEIVGYFALHIFERELGGEPVAIFRAEAGTARAYRGANANSRWGCSAGSATWWRTRAAARTTWARWSTRPATRSSRSSSRWCSRARAWRSRPRCWS